MTLCVHGAWKGWSGRTVVRLSDGSVWRQAEYLFEYHYAYRPSVTLANSMLLVDGMSRAVRVRRA